MDQKFRCEVCKKGFTVKRYLTKHVSRVHTDAKPKKEVVEATAIECSMCGKTFPRLSHLQRHQLTHLDIREWGCPYCDDRFIQKAHMLRHVGRKHENESKDEFEERIAEKRSRLDSNVPVATEPMMTKKRIKKEVGSDEDDEASTSKNKRNDEESQTNMDSYVTRIVCVQCGHVFKTVYEWRHHKKTKHTPVVCKRCSKVVLGWGELRRHEMICRKEQKKCRKCGSTFERNAELRSHENACFKKATFLCIPCNSLFKQRVQLDRHIKRLHFTGKVCDLCDFVADTPVHRASHAKSVHDITLCGYCFEVDPEEAHIAENHWKKLKKAVKIEKKNSPEISELALDKTVPSCDVTDDALSDENRVEEADVQKNSVSFDSLETTSGLQLDRESEKIVPEIGSPSDPIEQIFESATDFDFHLGAPYNDEREHFINLILRVPEQATTISLSDRLPRELVQVFPVLAETKIVLLDDLCLSDKPLAVQVPVTVTNSPEAAKWLSAPIHI